MLVPLLNAARRKPLLARFRRSTGGNVAMLFGVSLFPVLAIAGAAVDYGRATSERGRLQQAVDATALALPHGVATMSDAELQALGAKLMRGRFEPRDGATPTIAVTRSGATVKVTGALNVPTTVMRLVGQETMTVHAEATAGYGGRKMELALVLDTTASMANDMKIETLRTTATNFLNSLAASQPAPGALRVAIAPYSNKVKVPTSSAGAWLSLGAINLADWTGCVDQRPANNDTNAEPGALYPAIASSSCSTALSPVVPLTDMASSANQTMLKAAVSGLKPGGDTNVTLGMAWGAGVLHPQAPLGAGAAPFGSVPKVIVLITDGLNISKYTSDERTLMACADAKAKGIRVITVKLVDGDAAMLKACASSPSDYYEATAASALNTIFTSIHASITTLRLIN